MIRMCLVHKQKGIIRVTSIYRVASKIIHKFSRKTAEMNIVIALLFFTYFPTSYSEGIY